MFTIVKNIVNFAIVCVVTCLIIPGISLAKIVIVKTSGDIKAYELAYDGFKSVVNEEFAEFDIQGDLVKGKEIVEKIKRLVSSENPPSLIVTIGLIGAKLIKDEIKGVPVVFSMVINPEMNGLTDLKNLGGVSFDLDPKTQLSRLHRVIPGAKNIGVMYDPANSSNIIKEAKKTADTLGLNLITKEVQTEKDVPNALRELIKNINLLWLIPDDTVLNKKSFKFVRTTVMKNLIPAMGYSPELVKMGLPFSLYADEFMTGKQAGLICNKVLAGKLGEFVPVESPQDVFLAINMTTMKKFGLKTTQKVIDAAKVIYK